jgi:hypothetical protein
MKKNALWIGFLHLQDRMSAPTLQDIVNSHALFGSGFDEGSVNNFIGSFREENQPTPTDPAPHSITAYIMKEHDEQQKLKNGITVTSLVKGFQMHEINEDNDPMCIVKILYNNKNLIHLTIHLAPTRLFPYEHGMIHIVKDCYKSRRKRIFSPMVTMRIHVSTPLNKPLSKHFTLIDDTHPIYGHAGDAATENRIKEESDILIGVLNKMFNQDEPFYYIGHPQGNMVNLNNQTATPAFPKQPITDLILNQMNRPAVKFSRKNKGTQLTSTFGPYPKYMYDPLPSFPTRKRPSSSLSSTVHSTGLPTVKLSSLRIANSISNRSNAGKKPGKRRKPHGTMKRPKRA